MAEEEVEVVVEDEVKKLFCSYIGLSFSIFLSSLPKHSLPLLHTLQSQLSQSQHQLLQLRSRRQEDSKANARVVDIFATHRNAWQAEEKRLLRQIDAAAEEIARLRARVEELESGEGESNAKVEELEKEVGERDEMIRFMSRKVEEEGLGGWRCRDYGVGDEVKGREWFQDEVDSEFLASASKFWDEKASIWQDVQYESLETMYDTKHFVTRRESPWKVDGDSAGVSPKLKLLEQELLNLEKIGKSDLSKVPSLMRKQAKRYQTLSGKIDDLCRRIENNPCEPTLSTEFRTQRQTEFLLEAFRLQQRASETGQKLTLLQTEIGKNHHMDEFGGGQAALATRRCFDSIRNNLKEIQRNLEIWLARIIGDLEGILARDGASRVREYYISRYPFIQ
ncbi:PREDICTED: uncharacterized protein LOC109350211 isoform X2 [Lupinus angustifolius]|uniref:uncharacterized protein LOC109350211 isoform X2 n=1 Tax=Lupinus angustifolius TaxID=3871 RepID=UPI00092EB883|nr:PREDICTED: uncharacterized protein LOC109350211 isoform X2 [Lupinus angustifolius]